MEQVCEFRVRVNFSQVKTRTWTKETKDKDKQIDLLSWCKCT